MQENKNLVIMEYCRRSNADNILSAVVTENQVDDIKRLLPHIRIVNVAPAPQGSERDYLLV